MGKHMQTTEQVIDLMIDALDESMTFRQSHMAREALRSLVRLAKVELIMDMKKDVALALGGRRTRRCQTSE